MTPEDLPTTADEDPLCGNRLSGLFDAAMENPSFGHWEPPTPEHLAALLPQYVIYALIGRGGMGAVYHAEQTSLNRPVAIKLLPGELAANVEFLQRFQHEARTLARLQHPGIVSVYDFGQTVEGHLYFIMEFVDGTDLQRIIRDVGMDSVQALEWIAQICEALQYAHGKGVIHRDIKPANVLITQDGRAKLADFGLARPLDGMVQGAMLTATNQAVGTPDYMAPEQWMGKGDERTDIYALGVMFYEMLTGTRPKGMFDLPSQKVSVDVRVDEVVIKALRQEPERRYQQVREMGKDVDHIRHTPPPGTMSAPAKAVQAPVPRPKSGKKRSLSSELSLAIWILVGLLNVGYALAWYFNISLRDLLGPATVVETKADAEVVATTEKKGFTNSLGMKFVPIPGAPIQMCIHETRVQDFEAYANSQTGVERAYKNMTNNLGWLVPSGGSDPVTGVIESEMDGFCSWLSRKEGRIYRLPTDHEWSMAIGIGAQEDLRTLPRDLSKKLPQFLWGSSQWPPPPGTGNLADSSMSGTKAGYISGYTDGFLTVSPVMSFRPNALGLYDLVGNVWEWTSTFYDEKKEQKVLRGSSWTDSGSFQISHRTQGGPTGRVPCYGFRLVADDPVKAVDMSDDADYVKLLDSGHAPNWQSIGDGSASLVEGELTFSRPPMPRGAATYWYAKQAYADFVLRLDFRLTMPQSNSGVILRFADPAGDAGIPDKNKDHYHVDISNAKSPMDATGAIMFVQPPFEIPARTTEWSTMQISAIGQRYLVWVNGKLVNDFAGKRTLRGYIGLQNYRPDGVFFRNIRIKEL